MGLQLGKNAKSFHDHLRRRPKTDTSSEARLVNLGTLLDDDREMTSLAGSECQSESCNSGA